MNFNEKLLAEAKELEKLWETRSTMDYEFYKVYQKAISLESERLANEKKKRSKKEKTE